MFNVSVEMSLIKEDKSVRTGKGRPSTSVERAFIAKKKRRPAAPIPNTSIRTDCYDHLPSFTEKKGNIESLTARDSHLLNVQNVTNIHDVRLCLTKNIQLFSRISRVMSE